MWDMHHRRSRILESSCSDIFRLRYTLKPGSTYDYLINTGGRSGISFLE